MNADILFDIVEVYINTSFKECVMYCTDENIISKEYEKEVMLQYNSNEDLENEVIIDFFDKIGITEDLFLKYSKIIEDEDQKRI